MTNRIITHLTNILYHRNHTSAKTLFCNEGNSSCGAKFQTYQINTCKLAFSNYVSFFYILLFTNCTVYMNRYRYNTELLRAIVYEYVKSTIMPPITTDL